MEVWSSENKRYNAFVLKIERVTLYTSYIPSYEKQLQHRVSDKCDELCTQTLSQILSRMSKILN